MHVFEPPKKSLVACQSMPLWPLNVPSTGRKPSDDMSIVAPVSVPIRGELVIHVVTRESAAQVAHVEVARTVVDEHAKRQTVRVAKLAG